MYVLSSTEVLKVLKREGEKERKVAFIQLICEQKFPFFVLSGDSWSRPSTCDTLYRGNIEVWLFETFAEESSSHD